MLIHRDESGDGSAGCNTVSKPVENPDMNAAGSSTLARNSSTHIHNLDKN